MAKINYFIIFFFLGRFNDLFPLLPGINIGWILKYTVPPPQNPLKRKKKVGQRSGHYEPITEHRDRALS